MVEGMLSSSTPAPSSQPATAAGPAVGAEAVTPANPPPMVTPGAPVHQRVTDLER